VDLLVVIALAVFWYGLVPFAGGLVVRERWRKFRRRFDDLRLKPFLDYASSLRDENGEYRFFGGFESVTEDHILWIHRENLTIPVDLSGARTYMLPNTRGDEIPAAFDPGEEVPEKIRWDRVSALAEGAKVFVGGALVFRDKRPIFASLPGNPLLIIFYEGPDRSLTVRTIRAGRHKNKYWNFITPYALVLGVFSQIIVALPFLSPPVFRLNIIATLIAIFVPLLPLIPPGILLALCYRRFWWQARIFRAYRDLARLPLRYIPLGKQTGQLPDGENYVIRQYETLPAAFYERKFPFIIPAGEKSIQNKWYVCGGGGGIDESGADGFPQEPADAFAVFGAYPGDPAVLAARYHRKSFILELISWVLFFGSMGANLFFIILILNTLRP
jgi:hypothetical protein